MDRDEDDRVKRGGVNEPQLDPKWKHRLNGNEVAVVDEASPQKENLVSLARKKDLISSARKENLLSKWTG